VAAIGAATGAENGAATSAAMHIISTGSISGAGDAAISGAVDGACGGFMWGGIAAGAANVIGAVAKVAGAASKGSPAALGNKAVGKIGTKTEISNMSNRQTPQEKKYLLSGLRFAIIHHRDTLCPCSCVCRGH